MLKYALLGAAMAITAPALAQTTTTTDPAMSATPQTAPTTADPAVTPQDPATSTAPADTATAPADATTTAPAETAAAQPAADSTQIASVVETEFGTYDKDADGKLNEAEFGTWMVALKSQTDPATDANSKDTKSWNKAAFAQADTDKSKSLTKAELTGFLAPASKS